jgi:hypothetical protein
LLGDVQSAVTESSCSSRSNPFQEQFDNSEWLTVEEIDSSSRVRWAMLDISTVLRVCSALPSLKSLTLGHFMYKPSASGILDRLIELETLNIFETGTWAGDNILGIFDCFSASHIHLYTFRRPLDFKVPVIRFPRGLRPISLDLWCKPGAFEVLDSLLRDLGRLHYLYWHLQPPRDLSTLASLLPQVGSELKELRLDITRLFRIWRKVTRIEVFLTSKFHLRHVRAE